MKLTISRAVYGMYNMYLAVILQFGQNSMELNMYTHTTLLVVFAFCMNSQPVLDVFSTYFVVLNNTLE